MSAASAIEWTEATWNPVTGCTKVSPGCRHCYAERMARRLQAMGQPNYVNGFEVTVHEHMLEQPLGWRRPRVVFVNSMSDLFHERVPLAFIRRVFEVMRRASWHTFQVLTKRSERLAEVSPSGFRFSSSSGEASTRKGPGARWRAGRGTKCRLWRRCALGRMSARAASCRPRRQREGSRCASASSGDGHLGPGCAPAR